MDQIKVTAFLEQNKDFLFPNKKYTNMDVENTLMAAPDEFEMYMSSIPLRKPATVQIISVFPGSLGVDRFYLGEIGKGILKYVTFAGFGIWWIADIISAKDRCRAYNCKKLMDAVKDPSVIAQMQNIDSKISRTVAAAKKFAPVAKEIARGA
jgi:TM2 domain-containing membrane protein YozV